MKIFLNIFLMTFELSDPPLPQRWWTLPPGGFVVETVDLRRAVGDSDPGVSGSYQLAAGWSVIVDAVWKKKEPFPQKTRENSVQSLSVKKSLSLQCERSWLEEEKPVCYKALFMYNKTVVASPGSGIALYIFTGIYMSRKKITTQFKYKLKEKEANVCELTAMDCSSKFQESFQHYTLLLFKVAGMYTFMQTTHVSVWMKKKKFFT